MNEGWLPNVEVKDTSAQSGWGWSRGGQKKYNRLQRARGAAVPAAPSPLSLSRGPTNSGHSCRHGSRARGETQGYERPPSKVARHYPALRVEGAEAPVGIRPARNETPYYEPEVGDGVGRGWRDRRRTQEPLPPPASNLLGLASPSRPRPAAHSPRLTSRAAAEQEGSGEHEQEKQKQAGEDSHGAAGPASGDRPPVLSTAPAVMALLFIRAPGGGGARITHGPLPRPLLWLRNAANVAAWLRVVGSAGSPRRLLTFPAKVRLPR